MDFTADHAQSTRIRYQFGPFALDPSGRKLLRAAEEIHLQPKTFDLLHLLVQHPGRAISKRELLDSVWPNVYIEEGVLSVHVSALRKALGDADEARIDTVPRIGYRFAGAVTVRTGAAQATVSPDVEGRDESIVPPVGAMSSSPSRRLLNVGAVVAAIALAGVASWRAADIASRGADISSVAVLPFEAVAEHEDLAHLEIGMADALITRLGGTMRVPSTATVRHLVATRKAPMTVAAELDVDAVLTGTLQRENDRIRVTAQLVRVADGTQLWSGRFDDRLTGIFALQDAMADQIAASLVSRVGAARPVATRPYLTNDSEAYELYLRGRELWHRRTPESIRTALTFFERAVERDPRFALAYVGLADAYAITVSGLPALERFPKARAAALQALALAPDLGAAHNSLAFLTYKSEWDWKTAERSFTRAIELDPNYALAYHWYGEFLGLLGRYDESLALFARAREIEPYSIAIILDMSAIQARKGQFEEARKIVNAALTIDPKDSRIHSAMSSLLTAEGRPDEALEWTIRARMLNGATEEQIRALRDGYAQEGALGRVRAELPRLQRAADLGDPRQTNAAGTLAGAYGLLGERELAFKWLAEAVRRREDTALQLRRHPAFDALRGDPRFSELERQVGMP